MTDSPRYKIFLGLPHSGSVMEGAARGAWLPSKNHEVSVLTHSTSLLAAGFNHLFCTALNKYNAGEITHMAFLHADIHPQDYWLDVLVDEMDRLSADFISVVSPIKDNRGITSTAIGKFGYPWSPIQRLTMRQLMEMPETFDITNTDFPEHVLLHNSGCWLADLRSPVYQQEDENHRNMVFFTIRDRVLKRDNLWQYDVASEDWEFSRRLYEQGAKTYCTRKVALGHIGYCEFRNDHAWGEEEKDEQCRSLWEAIAKADAEAAEPVGECVTIQVDSGRIGVTAEQK